jgi:hypothetical protein
MQVVQPRAVVHAVAADGVTSLHELLEKRIASLAAVRDAGEACVLARDAHAGVPHHEHEEARLALGEAESDDRLDPFVESQYQNSSATPPWRLLPPAPAAAPTDPEARSAVAREA